MTLTRATTSELVAELNKREGVRIYTIEPDVRYCIEDETGVYEQGDGKATILVVKEP